MQKLSTLESDGRGSESHFLSWMILGKTCTISEHAFLYPKCGNKRTTTQSLCEDQIN